MGVPDHPDTDLRGPAGALVKIAFFGDTQPARDAASPTGEIVEPQVPVTIGTIQNDVTLQGTVAADAAVEIKATLARQVRTVMVSQGQYVDAGAEILTVRADVMNPDGTSYVDYDTVVSPTAGVLSSFTALVDQTFAVGDDVGKVAPPTFHVPPFTSAGTEVPMQFIDGVVPVGKNVIDADYGTMHRIAISDGTWFRDSDAERLALGLLNISLVTVRQRVREIGIRRSFGATAGRVFFAVMMESVVATLAAGVIGVFLAVLIVTSPMATDFIGQGVTDLPPFPLEAALIGLGAATLVGALAGLLPAIVPVRVKVIDAIRF